MPQVSSGSPWRLCLIAPGVVHRLAMLVRPLVRLATSCLLRRGMSRLLRSRFRRFALPAVVLAGCIGCFCFEPRCSGKPASLPGGFPAPGLSSVRSNAPLAALHRLKGRPAFERSVRSCFLFLKAVGGVVVLG